MRTLKQMQNRILYVLIACKMHSYSLDTVPVRSICKLIYSICDALWLQHVCVIRKTSQQVQAQTGQRDSQPSNCMLCVRLNPKKSASSSNAIATRNRTSTRTHRSFLTINANGWVNTSKCRQTDGQHLLLLLLCHECSACVH